MLCTSQFQLWPLGTASDGRLRRKIGRKEALRKQKRRLANPAICVGVALEVHAKFSLQLLVLVHEPASSVGVCDAGLGGGRGGGRGGGGGGTPIGKGRACSSGIFVLTEELKDAQEFATRVPVDYQMLSTLVSFVGLV